MDNGIVITIVGAGLRSAFEARVPGDGDPFPGVIFLELEFLRPTLPDRIRYRAAAGIGRLAGLTDLP